MDFSLFIPNMIKIWGKYWQLFLLTGLKNTLLLTCISVALGTLLGTVIAMLKMSKFKPIRFLVTLYIEVLRGTPILLQKGADDLTAKVNEILAETESQWDAWYEEAKAISGIDQSYDDAGNAITG